MSHCLRASRSSPRTGVYQYYSSTEALLTAAVESMFTLAAEQVRLALHGSADPWQQVRAEVAEHYQELTGPLTRAIAGLPGPAAEQPDITTHLVLGVIGAAIGSIRSGQDPSVVTEAALSFIAGALGHPRGRSAALERVTRIELA